MKSVMLVTAMLAAFAVSGWATVIPDANLDGELHDLTTSTGVPFVIYLPPDYNGGSEDYPVIYHLHGINNQQPDSHTSYKGQQIHTVPLEHEQAVGNAWIEPCIIVFPDGYGDAWWADSYDGSQPAESDLIVRLIPWIDSHYRTLDSREYRIIEGFSMGGFGTAKFASKYPNLFCCGLMYDGALLRWDNPTGEDILHNHDTQANTIFNYDEDYFDQYSPWYWVEQNHATIAAQVPLRQVVTKLEAPNVDFSGHLDLFEVPHEYPGYPGGGADQHNLSVAMNYDEQNNWEFLADALGQGGGDTTPPGNVTNLSATPGDTQIALSWTNPGDADLAGVKVQRKTGAYPTGPTDGTTAYNQLGTGFTDTGLTNGVTYYYKAFARDEVPNYASGTSIAASPEGSSQTEVTFDNSVGTEDGWVLESTETSGVGGSIQAGWLGASGLLAGDDSGDKQYKGFLSFDTSSLPDGATIVSATLRLKRGTVSGTSPFTTHGTCYVDIRTSGFNGNTALETADFQASATASQVATMSNAPANGDWSEGTLNSSGRSAVNKTGKTQFRVYFSTDDNDDSGADYIGYYPGDNATQANRPQLVIVYE